jgi:putative protease
MTELASPAGDWPSLRSAIESGCDSVYFGLKVLNMRAAAKNFELSEIGKVVKLCHDSKIKCYLTLNTIVYENEIEKLKDILNKAKQAKVDAVIAWDLGVITEANKIGIPVHLSTQASVSNFESFKFYSKYAERIVLARELSLAQIKNIHDKAKKQKLKVEIECFVHGALCVSESGRCFTSQFLFRKSANRGECIQPCRRQYKVTDLETGDELKLENKYVMSPKDLCALPFIDKLISAGVDVFKIEGRNRAPEYVKTVTACYRKAIDAVKAGKFNDSLKKKILEKLSTVYNRKFSSGFYLGLPTNDDWTDLYGSASSEEKQYAGRIREYYQKIGVAEVLLEAGELKPGDDIFLMGNKTGVVRDKVKSIQINHKPVASVRKGMLFGMKLNTKVRKNDRLFVITKKK